jgi:hypothetical protein
MPLPLRFVREIHARLAVRYGSAWTTKWAGLDQEAVELDWAEQLDGMQPVHIKAALASLPNDFPPTCTAFRDLGRSASNRLPDVAEVMRLRDERGGAKPSREVIERLKAIAAGIGGQA